MGRRQSDAERGVCALAIVFLMGVSSCIMVFRCLIGAIRPTSVEVSSTSDFVNYGGDFKSGEHNEECCRGIEHLELWGDAVKWGSDFKLNSSRECCLACKAMCDDQSGGCFCDSWVFCGDAKACGPMFGECWLKKQKDMLRPDQRASGDQVMWTSGLMFGKNEGIIRMETEYGTFRIKLFPACAPHSVNFLLELLALRSCVGCQFHRAESRGSFWFSNGDHVENELLKHMEPYSRRIQRKIVQLLEEDQLLGLVLARNSLSASPTMTNGVGRTPCSVLFFPKTWKWWKK